jgi:hypothetical protein
MNSRVTGATHVSIAVARRRCCLEEVIS